MKAENEMFNLDGHERCEELMALEGSGSLTAAERSELATHLKHCESCRELQREYQLLTKEGIPVLAEAYGEAKELAGWNSQATRERLFARVRDSEPQPSFQPDLQFTTVLRDSRQRSVFARFAYAPLAASLIVAIGFGAYRLGSRHELGAKQAEAFAEDRYQRLAAEKKSMDDLVGEQTNRISKLQSESSGKEQELLKLRTSLHDLEDHSDKLTSDLASAKTANYAELQAASQQREALNTRLRDAQQAYQNLQAELVNLRAERDRAVLRAASFESKIDELSAVNRDRERQVRDDEQYLASDRDIREMMGARQLYIADVFDVDASSRTRKPFGRVFYTRGKSLLFYAFDLDRQPGVKEAKIFEAWGQRETPQGEPSQPFRLGILYLDSEANRRWVLRCDDPKQLAEIDAVFVTVEPKAGSLKPTGKPLLYAMLRREANHP